MKSPATTHAVIFAASLLAGLGVAPAAHASGREATTWLNPGLLVTLGWRTEDGVTRTQGGVGVETSAVFYGRYSDSYAVSDHPLGLGAFVQLQYMGGSSWRLAIGPQVNYFEGGLEAGLALEGGDATHAPTVSLHLAPFGSIAVASLAFRLGIPLATLAPGRAHPWDLGFAGTLKLPVPLNGDYPGT